MAEESGVVGSISTKIALATGGKLFVNHPAPDSSFDYDII
jgi:hypothetical protein